MASYVGMEEGTLEEISAKLLVLERAISTEEDPEEKKALREEKKALREKELLRMQADSSHGSRRPTKKRKFTNEEEDEEDEFIIPKTLANQLKLLRKHKLSPSKATWKLLENEGILPEISILIGMVDCEPDVPKNCKLTELPINREICVYSDATNEGHPTLLCGNLITHIVSHINTLLNINCKFEIFPIVMKGLDARENKEADYSIYKVSNRVTYIVVEVKVGVGAALTVDDKDKLAQLFLEVIYTWENEGKLSSNNNMLSVLTDGTSWHIISTDLRFRPLRFQSLYSVSTKSIAKWDSNMSTICDLFVAHVKSRQQEPRPD